MLKKIGTFITPTGITRFGEYPVYDYRPAGGNSFPAEWCMVENSALECVVLLPATGPAIGRYAQGEDYLKWDLSINLDEDVRVLALTNGKDISGTGFHGMQEYAYLATDLRETSSLRLTSPVKQEMSGMDWVNPAPKKPPFPPFVGRDGLRLRLAEAEVEYIGSIYTENPQRRGNPKYGHASPARIMVYAGGEELNLGEEYNIPAIITAIRQMVSERSPELEEALLIQECLLSENSPDLIFKLVQFYQVCGQVADAGVVSDYVERKAKEESFLAAGGMYNLIARFRRMGASRNCDAWVIRPDGSLREPDELVRRKDYAEGRKRWAKIGPGELAVTWQVGLLRDVFAGSTCEVVHQVAGAATSFQIDALLRIEKEVGVQKGSFGPFLSCKPVKASSAPSVSPATENKIPATLADLMAKFNKR